MKLTQEQAQEIKDQQSQENKTKRVTAPELEKILYEAIPILDHGFVRVVDYMGDDTSIVQAARVSYGKGTKKVSTDSGLIKYLMRHRHSTPFEMCEIKYHVKLPIFVARQWIRHRTANVNEYSARYSILDKEFYLPSKENLAAQSTSNRQGRGEVINGKQADNILDMLKKDAEQTYANYETMLNERYDGSYQSRMKLWFYLSQKKSNELNCNMILDLDAIRGLMKVVDDNSLYPHDTYEYAKNILDKEYD